MYVTLVSFNPGDGKRQLLGVGDADGVFGKVFVTASNAIDERQCGKVRILFLYNMLRLLVFNLLVLSLQLHTLLLRLV